MLQANVVDHWDCNKGWDWHTLSIYLNERACNRLTFKKLSEDNNKEDGICWGFDESALFVVKPTYNIAKSQGEFAKG